MTMKKLLYVTMITFFSALFSPIHAGTYSDLYAARQACLNASSSQKAAACYKYNQMQQNSGSSSELEAAKRKCDNAPWSRKAADCYRYKQLRREQAQMSEISAQAEKIKTSLSSSLP
jgi:hypothetical protein